jgi:hypothetical protein
MIPVGKKRNGPTELEHTSLVARLQNSNGVRQCLIR